MYLQVEKATKPESSGWTARIEVQGSFAFQGNHFQGYASTTMLLLQRLIGCTKTLFQPLGTSIGPDLQDLYPFQ
jgi:hypothetical protein